MLLSTNAGVHFTDMTDDNSDQLYPVELHPDHHALVTNPQNWRQFFDVGDGGIVRSNGTFIDDSGDCVDPKGYVGSQLTFCRLVLSRIPERLQTLNEGLRTLHFYEIAVSPHNPDVVVGGTQDNGSWERSSGDTWVNTNIADGGHNNFDIGNPNFRQSSWQQGQLMVGYTPRDQVDQNWIADTLWEDYAAEPVAFIAPGDQRPANGGLALDRTPARLPLDELRAEPGDPRRGRHSGRTATSGTATSTSTRTASTPWASTAATTGSRWGIREPPGS